MRKLRNAVFGVLAAAAIVGVPANAYAGPTPAPAPHATQAENPVPDNVAAQEKKPAPRDGAAAVVDKLPARTASADGYLYVWSDDTGHALQYAGNQWLWPDGWNNKVDVLWNNGFPGGQDRVNIYDYPWQNGAYACIGNGDWWDLRAVNYVFSWVNDGADDFERSPLGRSVHDNGTSHAWVSWCGNNNRL
ncbi:hypothetical protein [Streptosporangium sp. NPDC051022]|uniref:hypothetical protein n=1 Tax=Streptosporangium sp. NPDC051022 TaxID=3155752 RepID=UPI00341D0340